MKLPFKNRCLLAPMLEPNDIAFRLLCKKAGCGLTYTGLLSSQSQQLLNLQDKPAIQIFCNSTKNLKQFIKKYNSKVSLWDLNLGCPSKLAKQLKHGAFLTGAEKIEVILKEIKSSTKKPVTIKLRKSARTLEIAKMAEKYCDAIAIHPRTQNQGYSGKPDIKFAEKLKRQVGVPIIYSGDVNEKNAKELLKKFDFVMIGREAIGNPGIFSTLQNKKSNVTFKDYLKLAKKYSLPYRQIKMQAMFFTKGLRSAKNMRRKLISAKTVEDIEKIMSFKIS